MSDPGDPDYVIHGNGEATGQGSLNLEQTGSECNRLYGRWKDVLANNPFCYMFGDGKDQISQGLWAFAPGINGVGDIILAFKQALQGAGDTAGAVGQVLSNADDSAADAVKNFRPGR